MNRDVFMKSLFVFSLRLVIAFTLLMPLVASAGKHTSPVKVEFAKTSDGKSIGVRLFIPKGWKVYAHERGDTGMVMKVDLSKSENLMSYEAIWPPFKSVHEELTGKKMTIHYYEGETFIPLTFTAQDKKSPINVKAYIEFGACAEYCVMDFRELETTIAPGSTSGGGTSLFYIILIAIAGGLILNIMPCVLPVLSLKFFSLVKHNGKTRAHISSNLFATVAGIVFSFMLLAVMTIALKNTGEAVGWGFHFQEPAFIMFLVMVLIIFASNLWGNFEINLPVWLNHKVSKISDSNINNSFLSGAFAALLATPCTAPFVTTAVAFAISQGNTEILIIFFFLGIGMGMPYITAALFPQVLHLLPKPGAWMITAKKIFAIMLLLTAVWLLSVLHGQLSLKPLLIFIGSLVLLKFGLFQKMKFKFKALFLSLVIIAGFTMPLISNNAIEVEKKILSELWEKFDEAKLKAYIAQDKIVFLDATADWCLTCKVNKFLVLDDVDLIKYLKEKNVVLMRADLTHKDPDVINFLYKRNISGIPYDAFFSHKNPEGLSLPTILRKHYITDALNAIHQHNNFGNADAIPAS